jgi:hypothetical protein
LTEEWLKEIENGNVIGSLMVDLTKAFDLVDHSQLLHKLKLYKCSDNSLKWFWAYLKNSKQLVKVNNVKSDLEPIQHGVPQGSILGPLLFLTYINDLELKIDQTLPTLFADDTTLSASGQTTQDISNKLQADLHSTHMWCKSNKMVLNLNKTKCMLISTKHKLSTLKKDKLTLNINLDNNPITVVHSDKLLGVTINETLSWKEHINSITKNVSYKLTILKRLKKYLPLPARKLYYQYYILPIFEYCCTVWGKTEKINLMMLIKLQKQAARIVLNKAYYNRSQGSYTSTTEMFIKLKWLPIDYRIKYHFSIFVYKAINNLLPQTYVSYSRSVKITFQEP